MTASTSDVRFVSSLAGVSCSTHANDWSEIFAARRVRKILRYALRCPGLNQALPVSQDEHQNPDHQKFQNNGMQDEAALRVGVDGVRDQLRHDQIQTVAGNGQGDQYGDQKPVRLEQREKPGRGRSLGLASNSGCSFDAHNGAYRQSGVRFKQKIKTRV